MASDELFTREEVLGGLPARRARALLFQIEIATAYAVENRKRTRSLTGVSERLRKLQSAQNAGDVGDEMAWLRAFGRGRNALPRPSIRQIERYASEWEGRMPESPRLRAALARLLGQTYRFTRHNVSNIRAALGMDTPAVQEAYQKLYAEPLDALYAPRVGLADRARWAYTALGKRLDALHPFWLAFAYALFGNFPSAVLIIPILAAKVGPMIGLLLLTIVGAINLVTITCMTEAVARSGAIQYRNAFLGRLTSLFLGRTGASLVYYTTVLQSILILVAGYVAFSLGLPHPTRPAPYVWITLLMLLLLYRLWRGEQGSSLTGDMLLGGASVGLIVLLSLIGLRYLHIDYLLVRSPALLSNGHWNFALIGSVVGGLLMCYCGHTGIPAVAKTVLHRDPSGHALIRGSILGTLCAFAFHCLWLLAVTGAVAADQLASNTDTALSPLGLTLGAFIVLLGFVGLSLFVGMDNTAASDVMFNLVRERLPVYSHSVSTLAKEKGRLLFHLAEDFGDKPRLGLTFLGARGGNARFRIDILSGMNVHRKEIVLTERWESEALFEEFPMLQKNDFHLSLELMEADNETARFLIATALQISHEGGEGAEGIGLVQNLDMEEEDRELLRWLMARGEATSADAAEHLAMRIEEVERRFGTLAEHRLIQRTEAEGAVRYRPRFARRRQSRLPQNIWQSLEKPEATAEAPKPAPRKRKIPLLRERFRKLAMSENGRFVLGASPVVFSALVAGWLVYIGQADFASLVEVCGILTLILSSGIFPILLLTSSRRKGLHLPQGMLDFLGHPVLLVALYLLFVALLTLHGLMLWANPWQRISALAVSGLTLGATALMARRGAFATRLVVELREDLRKQHHSSFRVMESGVHSKVDVRLDFAEGEQTLEAANGDIESFSTLRRAEFCIPDSDAEELRVWVHRVTPDGDSVTLPALLEIHSDGKVQHFDLGLSGGQALLPLPHENCEIHIILAQAATKA